MGLPELKQKIQMQIENADERLLRIVSSVFDNYLNDVASPKFDDVTRKKSDRRSAYSSCQPANYYPQYSYGEN